MISEDNYNVLFIEDNIDHAVINRRILERSIPNCSVKIIQDGNGAIDLFQKIDSSEIDFIPDITFLDLNLPGADGIDVLNSYIGSRCKDIGTMWILSCNSNKKIIEEAFNKGADGYIEKPLKSEDIKNILSYMENRKNNR